MAGDAGFKPAMQGSKPCAFIYLANPLYYGRDDWIRTSCLRFMIPVRLPLMLHPRIMMVTAGIEPATYGLESHCSNLSELSDHIMVGPLGLEPRTVH